VRVVFLTLDEVLALHADQITRYGGRPGIRDIRLLESALAAPNASFGGQRVYRDISEMAAVYLFHVVQNHPFVDGNKRAGLMAMLAFLGLNRRRLTAGSTELAELVQGIASGRISKAEAAVFIQHHTRRR